MIDWKQSNLCFHMQIKQRLNSSLNPYTVRCSAEWFAVENRDGNADGSDLGLISPMTWFNSRRYHHEGVF